MRIAWFSPLPPVRTGVAACSAELVAALSGRGHRIDTYPAESAHDFPWRHRQRRYDLTVYQFGNSSHHDYAWAYALRYPGLIVLHDTHLHHARAAFLLRERRAADYRAEFQFDRPRVSADAAELAIAGFDSRLYYEWPMVRALVTASRLTAVHGEGARRELIGQLAGGDADAEREIADAVVAVRLGHGEPISAARRADARRRIRSRYAIADDATVFVCAGGMSPEKRIPQVLSALRAIRPAAPGAHLLLAGAVAQHYDAAADIAAHGLREHVTLAGYLESEADLTDHLAASDVSLNLRWPTAREISGPWLRALAAGVPTIVTDLVHLGDLPTLDPRTWAVDVSRTLNLEPISVAIDILDEDHSLRLAMRRLAADAALRRSLARAGEEYWRQHHTVEVMADDYERTLARAAARPAPSMALPAHMRGSGDTRLVELLQPFGLATPLPADSETRS